MAELQKAKIVVHAEDKGKWGGGNGEFAFDFNPESIRVTKTVTPKDAKHAGQDAPSPQFTQGNALVLEFGEILFDTFEKRESVYAKHVTGLEKLITTDSHLHRPPKVFFAWGSGWGNGEGQIHTGLWFVTGLDVNYTMFLPNGTPVRCTCKLTLKEVPKDAKAKHSPDTAHVYLVARSDTLQGIAAKEYDDPSQWRRIAEANDIEDPLNLSPGRRLLIPPILR